MLETRIDEFYIVDFDRTLVDSDKLLEVFIEIAEDYISISSEQINKAYEDVKARGDSFDTASYVRDHLAESNESEKWSELEKRYIHESHSLNYLLPGASELLEWLTQSDKRYGILTYGNPLWQKLKLSAAGFNHIRRIIMEQKEKGRLISSWQQEDGLFHVPDDLGHYIAESVVLIDDKAVSFAEFPGVPSRGYWVLDPSRELPSQQGTVPANVSRHTDLYGVIEALR